MKTELLLRRMAFAEALTLLALVLIAVPLKHLAGFPHAVSWMGPLHGLAFLAFCWCLIQASSEGVINGREAARLLIGAFIPFGGIVNERWLMARSNTRGNI